MRDLILIHGRAQENKDAVALKAEWVSAWRQGLVAAGLPMPLSDEQIRFPYYGQTLYDLTQGEADVADIILKGEGADAAERDFLRDVVEDILQERGVSSEQLNEVNELDRDFIEKGVQDWTLIRRASGHRPLCSRSERGDCCDSDARRLSLSPKYRSS